MCITKLTIFEIIYYFTQYNQKSTSLVKKNHKIYFSMLHFFICPLPCKIIIKNLSNYVNLDRIDCVQIKLFKTLTVWLDTQRHLFYYFIVWTYNRNKKISHCSLLTSFHTAYLVRVPLIIFMHVWEYYSPVMMTMKDAD